MVRRIRASATLAPLLGLILAAAPVAAADAGAAAVAKDAAPKASSAKAAADKAPADKAPAATAPVAKPTVKVMSTTPDGKSISDSPYAGGPPPITGGFTDTTQGGTHTSGDYPVAPQRDGGPTAPSTK